MKPLGRLSSSGKTITFYSRKVPGLTSIYAFVDSKDDVEMEYQRLIQMENEYLEQGPAPICNEYTMKQIVAKNINRKFTVDAYIGGGRAPGGRRSYSNVPFSFGRKTDPIKTPSYKKPDLAYRINVKIKKDALAMISAALVEHQREVAEENRKKFREDFLRNPEFYLEMMGDFNIRSVR